MMIDSINIVRDVISRQEETPNNVLDSSVSLSDFLELIEENNSSDEVSVSSRTENLVTSISSDGSGTIKDLFLRIIGSYEMDTKVTTYQSNSGYYNTSVYTDLDYPWIISASFFSVLVIIAFYSCLKGLFRIFRLREMR